MIKYSWFIRFLKRLGIVKSHEIDIDESNRLKKQMCKKAMRSGDCSQLCIFCEWHVDEKQ